MNSPAPPIIKSAERLLLAIEDAVRGFARYHKYTLGSEIRTAAMNVARLAHKAWRDRARQAEWVGVDYRATPAQIARVPLHKRLANSPKGCGLPIGNLSSQFFANVYLDQLDQFVKHELKAKRYVRFVDDFVLIHQSRSQLVEWKARIEAWLADELRLELKAEQILAPVDQGLDFLGYVIYPTHRRARKRVISHVREALRSWALDHVAGGRVLATPAELRKVRSIWHSYLGHFKHANCQRLVAKLRREFHWLAVIEGHRSFSAESETHRLVIPYHQKRERAA